MVTTPSDVRSRILADGGQPQFADNPNRIGQQVVPH